MNKVMSFSLIGVALAALTGCAQNCVTVASASSKGGAVATKNGNIAVSTSSSRLLGNMLNAKVQVSNQTSKLINAKYRFQWFSPNGFNEGQPTPWTPIQITPHSSKVVSQVAPTTSSNNFNVLICQQ